MDNKKFIVPISLLGKVEGVLTKIERKRQRFLSEHQINEDEFPEMTLSYHQVDKNNLQQYKNSEYKIPNNNFELIEENTQNFVVVEFDGIVPVVDKWQILGEIKPLEDVDNEYTLHSYSEKDMPMQYRNLENPTKCEHCETNRKRKRTYIIKNKESEEVLQVGGSCMNDFIDKTSLSHLMSFSNLIEEINKTLDSGIETDSELVLFGKNEYLATQLAALEICKELGTNVDHLLEKRIWNDLILSIYDEERREKLINSKSYKSHKLLDKVLNETFVTDEHRDEADDILDFYEELEVSPFKDKVFNMKQILNMDSDFITEKESREMALAVAFYNYYENKSIRLRDYFANYNYGATIEQNLLGTRTFDKREVLAVLLSIVEEEDFIQYNKTTPSNPSTLRKLEQILIPEIKEAYVRSLDETELEAYNEKMSKFENYMDFYPKANLMKIWFLSAKSNNTYANRMISKINGEEAIEAADLKTIAFAANYYRQELEFEKLKKEMLENTNEELSDYSFKKGDKIEQIDLLYTEAIRVNSSFYGPFYIHKFEDKFGSLYVMTGGSDVPFECYDEFEQPCSQTDMKKKWITVSSAIHSSQTYDNQKTGILEKQIKLNRTKALSSPETLNPNNEMLIGGKFSVKELQIMDHKSFEKNGQNLNVYYLEDNGGNEYKIKTDKELPYKESEIFEAAMKISVNGKTIHNISEDLMKPKSAFTEGYEDSLLTERQAKKHFGIEVKRTRKPK